MWRLFIWLIPMVSWLVCHLTRIYNPLMVVSARKARNVTAPARYGVSDVRGSSPARAGTYQFEVGEQVITGWHSHDLHQLEYAFEGVAEVETDAARYLLPPQQAIWIPAGVEHCTTLTRVRTASVFLDPSLGINAGDRVRVIPAAPVIREMILYARCWPIDRDRSAPEADTFFAALAYLIAKSLDQEMPLSLPTSKDPLVSAAMQFTGAHLDRIALSDVCDAVNASERSIRRAFVTETGMSWRKYLLQSRLLKAMALLAEPGPSVLAVATAVGFETMSGLNRAFRRYTGETPLAYRQRVLASRRLPPQHRGEPLQRDLPRSRAKAD
jgi:AraC-like DNA-binding protein/quercetin dioxygenase-like cupin family protein